MTPVNPRTTTTNASTAPSSDAAVVTAAQPATASAESHSATRVHAATGQRTQLSESTPLQMAKRLMSETAHDIRSPLTTVREAVRLVRDQDLGEIGDAQRECLDSAIDQCDCIDHMIGEMVQLDRLQSGMPRANRSWVSVSEIRSAVQETLRPWALPRQIDVVWDGADDTTLTVYADPSMLRRMLVNLVANAIRVTPEGDSILIRLTSCRGGEAVQWSVIDQGEGIKEQNMRQIADRSVSFSQSSGLGLTICRQMAALHFSTLNIRSRFGTGTEVSFETPSGTAGNVAECWARWRCAQRGPLQQPVHRGAREALGGTKPRGEGRDKIVSRSRLDPPSILINLEHDGSGPRHEDRFVAGTVILGAALPRSICNEFDELLQTNSRFFDLTYRVDVRHWVWFFDSDNREAETRIQSIDDIAAAKLDGVRTRWSTPQVIHLNARGTAARISDMLIREKLAASSTATVNDNNQVRLGTAPLAPSEIAAARLDQELNRLSRRLHRQTDKLEQQARKLRPQ